MNFWFYLNILVLFIYVQVITLVTSTPCWCDYLNENILESKNRLLSRYDEDSLNSAYTYASSGLLNSLENRLLQSLENKNVFNAGILGGSYSLPIQGNSYAFNVTRWLNMMLSASECNENAVSIQKLSSTVQCHSEYDRIGYVDGCAMNRVSLESATFCSTFSDPEIEKSYLNISSLNRICDNNNVSVLESCGENTKLCQSQLNRRCDVFGGSGKYATLQLASKGGTNSCYGKWRIYSFLETFPLDLLIWDYSSNDLYGNFHECLFNGFLEQMLHEYPNIAGVVIVYWKGKENYKNECLKTGKFTWTNQVATIDYPLLKEFFDPMSGKFRNVTLLTMSLPQFCQKANCTITDFINGNTDHPNEHGISSFSDLLIWQLLKLFGNIYNDKCLNNSKLNSTWTIDLQPNDILTEVAVQSFSRKIPALKINQHIQPWNVVGTFQLYSPVIREPLSSDIIAISCFPTNTVVKQETGLNVFDLRDTTSLSEPKWVSLDIVTLLNSNCSGWNHKGKRNLLRPDDEHYYSPEVTSDCNVHCNKPKWNVSTPNPMSKYVYPHQYWQSIPIVKTCDILIRISKSFDWKYVCFFASQSSPYLIWESMINDSSTGINDTHIHKRKAIVDMNNNTHETHQITKI